jgi:hypothetical protein
METPTETDHQNDKSLVSTEEGEDSSPTDSAATIGASTPPLLVGEWWFVGLLMAAVAAVGLIKVFFDNPDSSFPRQAGRILGGCTEFEVRGSTRGLSHCRLCHPIPWWGCQLWARNASIYLWFGIRNNFSNGLPPDTDKAVLVAEKF